MAGLLRLRVIVGLAVVVFASAPPTQANLLSNGNFEAGNTGFTSDFSYVPGNITPAQSYDVVDDPASSHFLATSYGDHTTGTGLMLAVNGSNDTTSAFWRQLVAVAPQTSYDFSVWTSSWFSPAEFSLRINGQRVGPTFLTPGSNGVWARTVIHWGSSGANTTALLELVNDSAVHDGNDFAVDDLGFVAIASQVAGDYNASGQVEQGDLDLVLQHWGTGFAAIPAAWVYQRPSSGIVDQAELDGVLLNWGSTATPSLGGNADSVVPEPSAGWFLVWGVVLRRRGRTMAAQD